MDTTRVTDQVFAALAYGSLHPESIAYSTNFVQLKQRVSDNEIIVKDKDGNEFSIKVSPVD